MKNNIGRVILNDNAYSFFILLALVIG